MVVEGTPLQRYPELGLVVKREDLCCPGGPNFSKTRGVYSHVLNRPEAVIGVLDTSHSQGGWAVARACNLLGKQCRLFYPVYKGSDGTIKPQQRAAQELGAELIPLPAGRSAILYHRAKKLLSPADYMMPNALKLMESVVETAAEVKRTALPNDLDVVIVSASSGTIAAGLLRGLRESSWMGKLIIHMGYSRPAHSVLNYVKRMSGYPIRNIDLIDEGYSYADQAVDGDDPPFPCNVYYDLKTFRWLVGSPEFHYQRKKYGWRSALFWNIG
jgi:Pyridoxal-phosphate dependent enzyme